jgi:mRNA interferase MazF
MVAQGTLILIDFSPTEGREQNGVRPALVVSGTIYNERTGMALICPITSNVKGSLFKYELPEGLAVSGAVITDQVRNMDLKQRRHKVLGEIPIEAQREIAEMIHKLTNV